MCKVFMYTNIVMSITPLVMVIGLLLFIRFAQGIFLPFIATILNADFTPAFRATALSTLSIMSMVYLTTTLIELFSFNLFYLVIGVILTIVIFPLSIAYILINE